MKNNVEITELRACEELLINKKNSLHKRFGLKRVLEKSSNSRKLRFMYLPLSRLGKAGTLLIYFLLSIEIRKSAITVYRNKIIFDDHAKGLIRDVIFYESDPDYEKHVITVQLYCPLKYFFGVGQLKKFLINIKSAQKVSPLAIIIRCELWAHYILYAYSLPGLKYSGVIVVDDFSAKRLALVLAAKEIGLRTGIVKFSDEPARNCPFVQYDVLFSWNRQQSEKDRGKYEVVSHLPRSWQSIRVLGDVSNHHYIVGIALKSHFDEESFVNLISDLKSKEWVKEAVVRFHPSTKTFEYCMDNKKIEFKLSEGAQEIFFKDIDILIAGSTSLVKEAMLAGVPVVYSPLLDTPHGTDFYSYASEGIIYNLEDENLEKSTLEKIDKFYQSKKWQEMRNQWVSHDPEAISMTAALDYLMAEAVKEQQ